MDSFLTKTHSANGLVVYLSRLTSYCKHFEPQMEVIVKGYSLYSKKGNIMIAIILSEIILVNIELNKILLIYVQNQK